MSTEDVFDFSTYPTQSIEYTGQCAQKCVCDALDKGLDAIVEALNRIDVTLLENLNKGCKLVDECKDEIIQLIEDHYNTTASTCEECRTDLANGLGGTVEFAVRCAGACIDEMEQSHPGCSLADEGKPCTGCGNDPCTCVGGVCTPDNPQDQKKKHKYTGWCNFDNEEIFANRDDEDGPTGEGWNSAGDFDSEDSAIAAAKQMCGMPGPRDQQINVSYNVTNVPLFCHLTDYLEGNSAILVRYDQQQSEFLKNAADSAKNFRALGFEGLNVGAVEDVLRGMLTNIMGEPYDIASHFVPMLADSIGCGSAAFKAGAMLYSSAGVANKLAGVDLTQFMTRVEYVMNSECPQKYIGPDPATTAYLADAIDNDQLLALYKINGYCPENIQWQVDTKKSKLDPQQLVAMRHRGIINDSEYAAYMRQLGYVDGSYPSFIYDISWTVPDPSSVYRMVQQGALNAAEVDKLGLDEGYDQLQQGKLAEWLASNGITNEQASYEWRSHWTTPNLGSLIEFTHRLRDNPDFGGETQLLSDMNDAMVSLGIAPYWRKHFGAVVFTPLLKRDIKTAYDCGALKDQDLPKALRQTGHDDNAVGVLVDEYKIARRLYAHNHPAIKQWTEQMIDGTLCLAQLKADGYDDQTAQIAMEDNEYQFSRSTWADAFTKGYMDRNSLSAMLTNWGITPLGVTAILTKLSFKITDRQEIKDYIAGSIPANTAISEMTQYGMDAGVASLIVGDATSQINDLFVLECVRGVKHRYMTGEITQEESRSALRGYHIDITRVDKILGNWQCERTAIGRQIPVEKLCNLMYIGAISQSEFYERLIRLDYSEESAALLLYDCVQANTIKATKQAEAATKALISDANKKKSAADKAAAAKVRDDARLSKARAQAAKIRSDRDRQMISAAEKLYKGSKSDLATSVETVRAMVAKGKNDYGLTLDESLRIALLASESFDIKSIDAYVNTYNELAHASAESAYQPTLAEVDALPSTNGSTQPVSDT